MSAPKIDPWTALRIEYVANGARSLRAFAEQHHVSYSAVLRRAKREGWRQAERLQAAKQHVKECEAWLGPICRSSGWR